MALDRRRGGGGCGDLERDGLQVGHCTVCRRYLGESATHLLHWRSGFFDSDILMNTGIDRDPLRRCPQFSVWLVVDRSGVALPMRIKAPMH